MPHHPNSECNTTRCWWCCWDHWLKHFRRFTSHVYIQYIYIYYIYINIQIAQQLAKNVPVPTVPSDAHLRFELVATRPKAHKIQKPSTTKALRKILLVWVLNLPWNSRRSVGFDILKTSLLLYNCKTNANEPMQGVHQGAPGWLWNREYHLQIADIFQHSGSSNPKKHPVRVPHNYYSYAGKAWPRDACRRSRLSGGKVSWHVIDRNRFPGSKSRDQLRKSWSCHFTNWY